MSKIGKACLLGSGLFILASGVMRLILNQWHDSMYVSFGIALLLLIIAVIKDHRTYQEFLAMRTTKHGMNMGVLILLALVFLVSINFIAVKNDKKFDLTSEGLNSLSDQSIKAAKAVKEDLNVILLSRRDQQGQQEDQVRRNVQQLVQMYKEQNSKIGFTPYNARQRPDLAQKLEYSSGPFGLFIDYKGKHVRVEQATEEEMTKALIKMTRENKMTVYFTTGHGERSLESADGDGLSFLKEDLENIYTVKPLNLVTAQKVPEDATAIAIVGPTQQFMEGELRMLRNYARGGGHLLIAADPGQQHNLAQLTKTIGIEFRNNYILDPRAQVPGQGTVAAIGLRFSNAHNVTKDFPADGMTLFVLGSAISKAPDAPAGLKFDDIVKTDEGPVSTDQLAEDLRVSGRGPFTLAAAVEGQLPAAGPEEKDAPKESKEFSAVVFGDSDFITNKLYRNNLNRDLAMNSVASLAKDTEMISIRPKVPKGSVLSMTRQQLLFIVLGFLIPMPILMFGTGGVIWYRRRQA